MRLSIPGLACTGFAVLLVSGCGGSSQSSGGGSPTPTAPTASLTANPTSVQSGGTTTLTWTSNRATACTASGGWTGAKATSGSEDITNITAATTYTLVCSGDGGNSNPANATVALLTAGGDATANAGVSRTVISGQTVRLSGEASVDPAGAALSYAWTQTAGTSVTLTGGTTVTPTFVAPTVSANVVLTFSLVVNDGTGASTPSTVDITVTPLAAGNALVTGRVTFKRVLFATNLNVGLDYANQVDRPARGIDVSATNTGTSTSLATTQTDSDGNYALQVPANTMIDVYATARMRRDNTAPLPRWNFVAAPVTGNVQGTVYTYTDTPFSSATGTTHDVSVPSGLSSTGTATGTRRSAPFAVLDTVYSGMQTILSVAPTTNFPALTLDWAEGNPGGETFFDSGSAGFQEIVLSADLTEDTDEFDQHVIAHEFGHYIEYNFSRADNIGGSHGLGDKLDLRVAFGEGFGYAFAAIVLKDPVARDSFVSGNNQVSSTFNVETNPATNAPGSPSGNYGCWCSESTVWSVLWDLYDGNADTNDTVALGFKPMWDVLISNERTTPAMTSIFSFVTALKEVQASQAAAINTLLAAQNITGSGMDAFASTETHFPSTLPTFAMAGALPVYTTATTGTPVTVRSVDDAGNYNKLGNHRFVRYVKSGNASQTITVTSTAGSDPDVAIYRNGTFQGFSQAVGAESFAITTAGTYVFDVYDCSNGCTSPQGTPGDYDIQLTVN